MAWSASGEFVNTEIDNYKGTIVLNLDLETHKAALFGNSVTPDYTAASASTAYNTGTWLVANESAATGYTAGGQALTSTTVTNPSSTVLMWDANDPSWTVTSGILTAYGMLCYADALTTPVADQGILAVYFGGAFTVTNSGVFTVQLATTGIWRITY